MEFFTVILAKAFLGLFIGFCIGLTGIGGGVLVLPSLTLLLGMPSTVAVGTANLYACLCKLYATFCHWKQRTIDFKISFFFLIGAVPTSLIVAWIISHHARMVEGDAQAWRTLQTHLHALIAIVVLLSAVFIISNLIQKWRSDLREKEVTGRRMLMNSSFRAPAAVFFGVIIGGLIAATSVGGGIVIVPLLIVVFGLTAVSTVGSSIFIAVVLTLITSVIYGSNGQLDISTAVVMAAGSLAGVPVGTRLSKRLPDTFLQLVVSLLVLIAGLLMLLGHGE